MEEILAKLLVADSQVIQQGTKELKEAFKQPNAITSLCEIIVSSSNPQIRQSAAVLLRRKLGKRHQWNKLDTETRNRIKHGMLQALVNEQEKLVKNSIAQFIGIIGKHEFPNKTWPEILQFVHNMCSSTNIVDRELGMYTLSIMTEISKGTYLEHAESFALLFTNILGNLSELNGNLAYYTVVTMNNLVPVIGGHQQMINVYHELLPRVLEILNQFAREDEKKACELFEILDELVEYAVAVVVPHIRQIIEMCLQIGRNKDIPTSVHIKAIGVVGWLIRSKGKVIQKNRLVEPIIDVLIELMAQKPDDDVNEEYFLGNPDQFTSITIATQTLDLIALHIPPEKVVPYLLTRVEPAIQGTTNIYAQKAAYLALAVLAEGCSEKIRKKYLEPFLKCVCNAIHNPNVVVRNAAFFALGQFAEHLQPEISKYASELLPVLFEYLGQVYQQIEKDKVEPASLDRLFYALETFCENLDDELLPYLPTLMERLFVALDPNSWSLQMKRVALSALGSAVSAVKEGMLPYFEKVLEVLNHYIMADPSSEIYQLQCYAIETLAVVAQFIGPQNFMPLAPKTLELGLHILDKTDDPDVRKSVYALFAALAMVMKEEISPALPKIVEQMIESIQSSEGIVTHFDEEKDPLDIYDELSESEDDIEEDLDDTSTSTDDTNQRYSVENSYNEEKEQACLALREICANTGLAFLPYIEKSFEEIFKLINYPQEDIRKASIDALLQFCICLHKVNTQEGKQALYKALQMFIPKCSELIRTDEERSVAMTALDAYGNLLEEVKGDALVGEGHREAIMNCVIDVLTLKTMCQDTDLGGGDGDNADDDDEAEQDEMLLECAGDVIPKFGNAVTPEDFFMYFPNMLQLLQIRTKKQNSISQRSFAYGTLAECMKPLSVYVEKFVPQLLHLWLSGAKDSADEVRNNSIYGLGEMILHGKDCVFPHYNDILQAMSNVIATETHPGTLDNVCGTIAKMIVVNSGTVPLAQVFPVLLRNLPLKEDFQENKAVVNCFFELYKQGNQLLREFMPDVIKIVVQIYHKKQTSDEETENLAKEFLKMVNRDFEEEFAKCVSSLGQEVTESVQKLFT